MKKDSFDIGIIGLGVMGRNFALNMADHGNSVAGLDNKDDKASALQDEADEQDVKGTTDPKEFVSALKQPRAVMMLVPAGKAVDAVIDELVPLLDEGDLIVDGGNSHYTDTSRRYQKLKDENIHFMGVGISGGEEGARHGPSIMPGGSKEAYERVKPVFEAAAAQVNDEPCVTWLGPGAAGHYVKMVHNGIEYGLMQLIAECYDIMKRGLGFDNKRLHQVFSEWNEAELSSFLIEITADIFARKDDKAKGYLIDHILDSAKQKGTGKWASQDAMDLKVPVPNIDMAVAMRDISAYKDERARAAEILRGPTKQYNGDKEAFVKQLRHAMYFGMIATYAQGMALLRSASVSYNYDLNFEDIAEIWRGGCIIRAELLEDIRAAFQNNANLPNLLVDRAFADKLMQTEADLRIVIQQSALMGLPAPGLMSALGYYDSYRSKRLPANLIQAQRDDFGSHTYERTDREGTFHTEWNDNSENQ